MFTTIKAYLYGALVLVIVSGAIGVNWLYDSRLKYKASSEQFEQDAKTATANMLAYQNTIQKQASDLEKYQSDLQVKTDENNSLRDSVNVGTRFLRIKASCDTTTKGTDSSTTQTATIIDPQLRQDILNLRQGIITLEANYALCLKQLD